MEHRVTLPPDSSATSMKAGVNSVRAFRANQLYPGFHGDLSETKPRIPQISLLLDVWLLSIPGCPSPLAQLLFFPMHVQRNNAKMTFLVEMMPSQLTYINEDTVALLT